MPNHEGRFHLYSDTSKFTTGNALYQLQNGKPKLIVYVSKRLPEATRKYSITEFGIVQFSNQYSQLFTPIKRLDFDAIVDPLDLTHII